MSDTFDNMETLILEDGTIRTTSDKISSAAHTNADGFLAAVDRLAAGAVKIEKRTDVKTEETHHHHHIHVGGHKH